MSDLNPNAALVRALAKYINTRIEAGHFRRLPSSSLTELYFVISTLNSLADDFEYVKPLPLPVIDSLLKQPWWRW